MMNIIFHYVSPKHLLAFCLAAVWMPISASAQSTQITPSAERSHVVPLYVGQSHIIDAPWPVKRVSVTAPDIADVRAHSPGRIQLQGKSVGTTDLTMWSENEDVWQAQVEVVADLRGVEGQLAKIFPGSTLKVNQIRDVVVVTGSLARLEHSGKLREFMDAANFTYLDMTGVAGVQQVQLQVRIAEVSRAALKTLGINTFFGGNDFFGGITVGSSAGPLVPISDGIPGANGLTVPNPVTLFGGFPNSDLIMFIQALTENQYLRILAEPTLVAASGEEAFFLAGGEFPIPVAQGEDSTAITIEFKEFGVRLAFRPTVLGDGSIRMAVTPEVSELTDVGSVEVQGFRIPALLTRRVHTTLELKSGQTFGMAGLINRTVNARTSRIPGLGDLPVLGALFRSVRYAESDTELLVLVTASLVEPLSVGPDGLPVPGVLHRAPDPWEFYAEGRIEGTAPAKLSMMHSERLKELGLDRLRGPGAWATYEAPMPDNAAEEHR